MSFPIDHPVGPGAAVHLLDAAEVRAQCAAGDQRVGDHGRLLPGLAAQQRGGPVHHRPAGLASLLLHIRLLADRAVASALDPLVHLPRCSWAGSQPGEDDGDEYRYRYMPVIVDAHYLC